MGAFMVVILKMSATEAYEKFRPYYSQIKSFRDASKGDCFYECTVLHCLKGLEFAAGRGWYNFKTFSVKEYEHYEKVENGDLNWIIPGKFVAFMGPVDRRNEDYKSGFTPIEYCKVFKEMGVKLVIRLNEAKYDR